MPPRTQLNSLLSPVSLAASISLPVCRRFSTGPILQKHTRLRRVFFDWLNGPGQNFKSGVYKDTNYISSYDRKTWERKDPEERNQDVPFPLNSVFRSQAVLSDQLADEVYRRVVERGSSVRVVSAELGVSLERVAAVVRLKTIEKEWINQGKPIKTHLTTALHSMLPVTPLPTHAKQYHESIQDLFNHPHSHRQAFVHVPESRVYTRVDAGKEFGLPPADEAIPHPQLVTLEKERLEGLTIDERIAREEERIRLEAVHLEKKEREKAEAARNAAQVKEVGRWRWNLRDAQVGKVGFRYGVPHQDRRKGTVKIPMRVV